MQSNKLELILNEILADGTIKEITRFILPESFEMAALKLAAQASMQAKAEK
jgi:hypothetical protein